MLDNSSDTTMKTMESMEFAGAGVGLDAPLYCSPTHVQNEQDTIPVDPSLAEAQVIYVIVWSMSSHDIQYDDDFEDDDDEYSDLEDSQVEPPSTVTSL